MKKINILGTEYKIKKVDEIRGYSDLIGQINFENNTIEIKKGLEKQMEDKTMIHECLHATGHSELSGNEDFVERLETGIYQLFKENKFKLE